MGKDYPFPVTQTADRDENEYYRNFPKKKDRFNVGKYFAKPVSSSTSATDSTSAEESGNQSVRSVFPKLNRRIQKF
jgi:hypothetical protein